MGQLENTQTTKFFTYEAAQGGLLMSAETLPLIHRGLDYKGIFKKIGLPRAPNLEYPHFGAQTISKQKNLGI